MTEVLITGYNLEDMDAWYAHEVNSFFKYIKEDHYNYWCLYPGWGEMPVPKQYATVYE